MDIRLVDRGEAGTWDRYVMGNERSIAWHLYEWSDLVKKHHGCRFLPLAAFENGTVRGVLPLYEAKTLRGGKQLISVPHAVAGGIVADDHETEQALLNQAVKIMGDGQLNRIVLKQYKHRIKGSLKTDGSFYNRELALTDNPETVFADLTQVNQERIIQTRAQGFSLEYPSDDVSRFFKMLLIHHHRRGIPCVSRRWIQDLVSMGLYSIALLRSGNRIAAGTMVKTYRKTVSFPFTCLPDEGEPDILAAYRLYWELITRFAMEGCEIFHSGRIPNSDETDIYRLGWGGQQHAYFYQYYPDTVSATESSRKGGTKRRYFEAAWRTAPLFVVRALGPFVVRQFP
jgi:hypothetical protein